MIIKLFTLDGIRRRADRTVSLTICTAQEQTSEEMTALDRMFQNHILVAIKPEDVPFLDAELDSLEKVELDLLDPSKSPRKRLRSVLWLNHEKHLKRKPEPREFMDFYDRWHNEQIEKLKDKLND